MIANEAEREVAIKRAIVCISGNTIQMNAAAKQRWLTALDDPETKQAQGTLLDGNGAMCCLGVLGKCQGFGNVMEEIRAASDPNDDGQYHESDLEASTVNGVLGDVAAAGIPVKVQEAFAVLNDNGYTFAQIRDLIDKHL